MDVKRGQAVVIDGIFFLMLCGMAAATLLWSVSVYGDKSFEAYRYIYMTDYSSGALAVLSNLDYVYTVKKGLTSTEVKTSWLDELGAFMLGEFSEDSDRYKAMIAEWENLCNQAPAPLLMTVYTEYDSAVRGTRDKPLYFSCGKDEKNLLNILKDDDGNVNVFKFPYYASPVQSKSCATLRCVMDIKIYY